jgi:hypothetical protein
MQLGSLEPVYDIYLYKLCYTVCIYLCNVVPCVKNLTCGSLVDVFPGSSVKTLSFEHKTLSYKRKYVRGR